LHLVATGIHTVGRRSGCLAPIPPLFRKREGPGGEFNSPFGFLIFLHAGFPIDPLNQLSSIKASGTGSRWPLILNDREQCGQIAANPRSLRGTRMRPSQRGHCTTRDSPGVNKGGASCRGVGSSRWSSLVSMRPQETHSKPCLAPLIGMSGMKKSVK